MTATASSPMVPPATTRKTNRHTDDGGGAKEDEHDALFRDAQAWCDGANSSSSIGSARSGNSRKKLVRFPNGAKRSEGGHGLKDANVYNDSKLSRSQPWRLRYPTPHDLKEQLSRGSASDDGV